MVHLSDGIKSFLRGLPRGLLGLAILAAFPLLALGLGTFQGCSEIQLPGPDMALPSSILVLPTEASLTLRDGEVPKQRFRAYGYYALGAVADLSAADAGGGAPGDSSGPPPGMVDITDQVTWSVEDQTMGSFDGTAKGLFRTALLVNGRLQPAKHGGKTQVFASYAGIKAPASVSVAYYNSFYRDGAPADADTKFSGAKVGALSIYYPADQILVPPNLGQMEVQYSQGSTAVDLFRISFTSDVSQVNIYTTQTSFNLDLDLWPGVGLTNMGRTVLLTVSGVSTADPSKRWASATYTLYIAETEVRGGLYYWVTTSPDGIYRYNFDQPTKSAEAYYTRKEAGDCIGCHAVSRGGEYIAFTLSASSGDGEILDVKRRVTVRSSGYARYKSDVHTFSPNGDQVITVQDGVLTRRAVKTGQALETLPTGAGKATQPDWSPDGTMVVYVQVADADYRWVDNGPPLKAGEMRFRNGSLYLLQRSGRQWESPKLLVKASDGYNYYYPSFSPKGDWILYNRSKGDSYSDAAATIFAVKPDGTGNRLLTRIHGDNLSNSWPRWSPFVQKFNDKTIYWFTFSSVRDYGVKLKNSLITKFSMKKPQIWMTAFDVERAEAGLDPSYPAFWLPFQSITANNHIAQWTEKLVTLE